MSSPVPSRWLDQPRCAVPPRLMAPASCPNAPSRSHSGCSCRPATPPTPCTCTWAHSSGLPAPCTLGVGGAEQLQMARPADLGARQVGRGHQPGPPPRSLPNPLPFLTRNGCALRSVRQGCRCWRDAPQPRGQGSRGALHAGPGRADGRIRSHTTPCASTKDPAVSGRRTARPPRPPVTPPR
eukprot:COSAG04_NODE_12_length_42844_cov_6.769213_27_plen_182_part_00